MVILIIGLLISSVSFGFGGSSGSKEKAPTMEGQYAKFNKRKTLRKTIVITKPGVYDYKNTLFEWKGKGSCNQQENQEQCLRIEANNVTVRNVAFRGACGDPIHITTCGKGQGNKCSRSGPKNVRLQNVLGHACEDFITIGTPGANNITIEDSVIFGNPNKKYRDKGIQINFGTDIEIKNNIFINHKRAVRFKPRTKGSVRNNKFFNTDTALLSSSKDADLSPMRDGKPSVKFEGNKLINTKNGHRKKDY